MNQSKIDRARAWLRNTPGAVAGQGGHNATFAVATALIHGFELNAGDAESLLHEYNAKCLPPWKPNELAHKLDQASRFRTTSRVAGFSNRIPAWGKAELQYHPPASSWCERSKQFRNRTFDFQP
jgi:hypothetical protein